MTSALDRVMDQAAQAESNFQAPATVEPNGGALAQQLGGGNSLAKPSMAGFAEQAGMTVDVYLSVKEGGFTIDEMTGYFDDFEATLDLKKVVPIYSARGEAGGNTTFIKSYDGISTPNGQNFARAVDDLSRRTKCTGVYQTAEIPVTLVNDVTDSKKSKTITAGTRVGITPSVTGFSAFRSFYADLLAAGRTDEVVKVKVKHAPRRNKNNNRWGVAEFELVG